MAPGSWKFNVSFAGAESNYACPAMLVSLSSVFLEVADAWLPSAIFCAPLLAACTMIAGAAALIDVTVAKPDRHVIDELRKLEALQIAVPAVLRNKRFFFRRPYRQTSILLSDYNPFYYLVPIAKLSSVALIKRNSPQQLVWGVTLFSPPFF